MTAADRPLKRLRHAMERTAARGPQSWVGGSDCQPMKKGRQPLTQWLRPPCRQAPAQLLGCPGWAAGCC
jgi:hypothetical protein